MNNNIFRIDGMTCDGCVSTIKTKLELENDISKAIVTLDDSRLELFSDKNYEISELNKILSSVGDYNVSNNSKNEKNIIPLSGTREGLFSIAMSLNAQKILLPNPFSLNPALNEEPLI